MLKFPKIGSILMVPNFGGESMENFWHTSETVPDGLGFSHFGSEHLCSLVIMVVVIAVNCMIYRRLECKGRSVWRKAVAILLIADELYKLIPMIITGRFLFKYLPFHLCSINLFLITWHAWRPNKLMDNFLYTVCIPGAMAAMLFPSWGDLPIVNYMVWHSISVHILLVMYPVVLFANGDIKTELRELPKCLLLLFGLGVVALILNLLFDTNFMFLMNAEPGNPLFLFEQAFGSHIVGFPILITAVIIVMHGPLIISKKLKAIKIPTV